MHCDSLFHKQSSVFCDIGEWCQCGTSVRQVELQRLQKGWIMEIRTKVNLFHTNREILKFFILFVKCKKNQLVQLNQYVHKKGQTLHGFSLWTVCMVWITSRVWARIWSLFFKGTIPIAVRDWRNGAALLKPWISHSYL